MLYKVKTKKGLTLPYKFVKYNNIFDANKFPLSQTTINEWLLDKLIEKVNPDSEQQNTNKNKQKSLLNDNNEQ